MLIRAKQVVAVHGRQKEGVGVSTEQSWRSEATRDPRRPTENLRLVVIVWPGTTSTNTPCHQPTYCRNMPSTGAHNQRQLQILIGASA